MLTFLNCYVINKKLFPLMGRCYIIGIVGTVRTAHVQLHVSFGFSD